jgi:AcrR family transcriptional regulator
MNHLVEATGMTRGALFFHFDSKDAVALAMSRPTHSDGRHCSSGR